MDYINIWGIAALAGIACLGFFFLLTRRVGSLFLRILLRCLGAVWILMPAPVPNYSGNFAPAFVVWIFEGVLKSDGEPWLSLQILLWSSLAVIGLVLFWYFLFGRRNEIATPAPEPAPEPETAIEPFDVDSLTTAVRSRLRKQQR
jgi:hypothetical protein